MSIKRSIILLLFLPLFVNITTIRGNNIEDDQNVNIKTLKIFFNAQKMLESSKSLKLADEMYNNSSMFSDKEGQLLSFVIKSEHYIEKLDCDSILYCSKLAKSMLDKNSVYSYYYFRIRYWVANILIYQHKYASALKEIHDYQNDAVDWGNDVGIGLGYKLMGDLLLAQNRSKSAFKVYEKGYQFLVEHNNLSDKIVLAGAIGKYYYKINDFKSAINWLAKSEALEYEENILIGSYIYLALSYINLGDMENAELALKKLEVLKNKHSLFPQIKDGYFYLKSTFAYIRDKDINRSLSYLNKINLPYTRYQRISQLYAKTGDYAKAYEYSIYEKDAVDSISDIDETILTSEYQTKYETDILRSEKNDLLGKNISLQLKQTQIILAVLVIFCITILIYLRYRQHVTNRLSKAMQMAEKERINAIEAKNHAEKADSLKSLFLQNMSHEIRTPLNAIVGFNDILNNSEEELSKDEKRSFVEIINQNSELLLTLVNDILDTSKYESGTYIPVITSCSVDTLCFGIIKSVENKVPDNIELRFNSNHCNLILNTDVSRLKQVLTNFITNSIKYTTEGFIELSYEVIDSEKVVFKVKDTGSGIKDEDIEKIFNRFEKLDSFKQGTGLGLNICLLISKMLHGKVYVDKSYKDGACFVFEHPLNLK